MTRGDQNIIHAVGSVADGTCTSIYPSVFTKVTGYRDWIKQYGLAKDSATGLKGSGLLSAITLSLVARLL